MGLVNLKDIFKLFVSSAFIIMLTLYLWKVLHIYNCSVLVFALFILLVIASSYIELKLQERQCFRECYFRKGSFLSKLFSSKLLIMIFYILVSVMMSITTVYVVIDFSIELWAYLLFHIFFVVLIYKALLKLFCKTITDRYILIFAREWSINISTVFLLLAFVYISLNTYEPSYLSDNLQDTISKASHSIGSQCPYIDTVLRIKIELDSTFWWLTDRATYFIKDEMLNSIVWVVFIIINSIALLGLNRFIAQIVHSVNKFISIKTDKTESVMFELSTFERIFWATIFWLFVVFIIFNLSAMNYASKEKVFEDKSSTVSQRLVEKYIINSKMRDNLSSSEYMIDSNLNAELKSIYQNIDMQMDKLFMPVEANVDRFLDFHYSVIGEYSELGSMAVGNMQKLIREKLFGLDFAQRLQESSKQIYTNYEESIQRHLNLIDTYAKKDVDIKLNAKALDILQKDINSSKVLQQEKLGALLAIHFTPKLMQPLISKLVAAGTVKVATKSATKAGAKMAAAGTGVAASAICGPFVWICAPVAAVTLWVATDVAVVSVDEYMSRDELKKEILTSLGEKKESLTREHKEIYYKEFNKLSKKAKEEYSKTATKQRIKIIDKI